MLIKVTYQPADDAAHLVFAEFAFGEKAAIGPSYVMTRRGSLTMAPEEWAALKQILSRGAKRPTTVVIEQAG